VGHNPTNYVDPFGLERFDGYCLALEYLSDNEGDPEEALVAAQLARGQSNWDTRVPGGDTLRNAENYLTSYTMVTINGAKGTAYGNSWAKPLWTGIMLGATPVWQAAGFFGDGHSPASATAVKAGWAGALDGAAGAPATDASCECPEK